MAAVIILTVVDESLSELRNSEDFILGSDQEFVYTGSYRQDDRFLAWLDAAILRTLEAWQARI